jgi:hypothetical protein
MKKFTLLFGFVLLTALSAFARISAIVESSDTRLVISARNSLRIEKFMRIKVLDEQGYQHAVYYDYTNKFRKVSQLEYTVFDINSRKVKKLSRNNAVSIMANASYEIADARVLILDPEYRNFPFIVEIEVEITYDGFLDFPEWMPRFTHDVEVKSATLTLECYRDFEFRARELNGIHPATVTSDEKKKTITWSVENLLAMNKHNSYKSFAAGQPKVCLTPVNFELENSEGNFVNWSNFGEWFRVLNEGRNEISPATKDYLNSLRKLHGADNAAIAKYIYRYMQGKTRYISIQLGIGGFQTIPADEVEKTGYGDCKALTNYMKSMLDYLNIPSNSVLVHAGRDVPEIVPDFPSNQFNHVFLAVPMKTDTLWFECTSQTSPPAFLGTFTDDRYVLWVDKNKSSIIRTPLLSETENVKQNRCVASMDPSGDAQLEIKTTQAGMFFDDAMYYQQLTKDRIDKFNYAKFPYKDFTIQSFNYAIPDQNNSSLDVSFKLKVANLGKMLGSKMIISSNILNPLENAFDLDLINKKTEVRRSFTLEDEVEIKLPENYRVDVTPEAFKQLWKFGSFELTFDAGTDSTLRIRRKAVIKKGNYQDDQFNEFYEMVRKIKQVEQSKIVLQSKT